MVFPKDVLKFRLKRSSCLVKLNYLKYIDKTMSSFMTILPSSVFSDS